MIQAVNAPRVATCKLSNGRARSVQEVEQAQLELGCHKEGARVMMESPPLHQGQ